MEKSVKSTFNLPNKTYYSGNVKGSGLSLGLTDGNNTYGFYQTRNTGTSTAAESYNRSLPSSGNNFTNVPYDSVIGITTDSSKSGIVVETDSQLKLCIKY